MPGAIASTPNPCLGERPRAIRVDPDVGTSQQLGEVGSPGLVAKIDECVALPETGGEHAQLDAGEIWRADPEHVGSVCRERRPRDGPREHARTVEHARASAGISRLGLTDSFDRDDREVRRGRCVRVGIPLIQRAQAGRDHAVGDQHLFELGRIPVEDSLLNSLRRGRTPEPSHDAGGVVAEVAVELDVTVVARAVVAREVGPARERPAVTVDSGRERLDHSVPVDRHRSVGQGSRPDTRHRSGGDVERRGEPARPDELESVDRQRRSGHESGHLLDHIMNRHGGTVSSEVRVSRAGRTGRRWSRVARTRPSCRDGWPARGSVAR